ncbi:MAG: EthD family reductase [Acidobacteriia bacterium]|nr:EthD family reductase [Terriglobia bacterium]
MIRVTVLYPAGEGHTFDMDYYLKTHIPLFQERMGAAMREVTVERGVAGGAPGSHPPYVAVVRGSFESVESFANAFAPHASEIQGDVPNYTNIQPIIQISEVLI